MLISGIKSKPVYRPLTRSASGQRHLLIAHGAGGAALRRLVDAFGADRRGIEMYYSRESILAADQSQQLLALADIELRCYANNQELETALGPVLGAARMGLRLYIAGTERFIWAITNLARRFDIRDDEIEQEQADSQARQMACVHCNALTYPVHTNIAPCSGCGRQLLVRDHFSRRLNAYMGLQINAEVPSELPPAVEVFVP
jgi:predicted RNA-binding Zn-ribbon protein involved in translation (DUF1610 family)